MDQVNRSSQRTLHAVCLGAQEHTNDVSATPPLSLPTHVSSPPAHSSVSSLFPSSCNSFEELVGVASDAFLLTTLRVTTATTVSPIHLPGPEEKNWLELPQILSCSPHSELPQLPQWLLYICPGLMRLACIMGSDLDFEYAAKQDLLRPDI